MKKLQKLVRLCGLMLFLLLAIGGASLTGAAPTPPKDRRMIGTESVMEMKKEEGGY
jgi:hypothetical protein